VLQDSGLALKLTTGSFLLWTGAVTLAKGELRTFIVQSTAYAATPGPGNTKVTNLLDNQWQEGRRSSGISVGACALFRAQGVFTISGAR